jgi:hypothetical protein
MKSKLRVEFLGAALALSIVALGATAYAGPPTVTLLMIFNKVVDTYNYLVNTINPKLNSILSSLTDDRADNLDAVSTELGMLGGTYFSLSEEDPDGAADIATVGTLGELARYTVTVSFIQGDADDQAYVFLSQDGLTYSTLFDLQPGAGERVVQTATVVATHIFIGAYNVNPNWPGAEPNASNSVLSWTVSAVGAPGTPELTEY